MMLLERKPLIHELCCCGLLVTSLHMGTSPGVLLRAIMLVQFVAQTSIQYGLHIAESVYI